MTTEETRPLLHNPEATDNESIKAANGKDVISFDPNGDPENPRDWPKSYKWSIVLLLAFTAFTVFVNRTLSFHLPFRLTCYYTEHSHAYQLCKFSSNQLAG